MTVRLEGMISLCPSVRIPADPIDWDSTKKLNCPKAERMKIIKEIRRVPKWLCIIRDEDSKIFKIGNQCDCFAINY